jgi:acyl-CoA reductase-like NAD-dependent aldehyde dehydrogenase
VVRAAVQAQRIWAATDWRERAEALRRIAASIRDNVDELAELEAMEVGKPLTMAREFDLEFAHRSFDYFASLLATFTGSTHVDGPVRVVTDFDPYGVVAGILPFNWPPVHTAGKSAPALATGNAVVLKPPEQAPSVVVRIVELMAAELPPGLVGVVCGGVDVAQALVTHPDIGLISFTGSPTAGRAVAASAGANLKPTVLELGGKNALIVLPDADLDLAVRGAIEGAYFNQGEACTAASRLLVHEDLYDEFVRRLGAAVERLVVGHPMDAATAVGPLVSAAQKMRVQKYLDIAQAEGATIAARASFTPVAEHANGFWIAPTLLTDVTRESTIANEEVFGPVAAVLPFATVDEAVEIANNTPFALVAAVYGRDAARAQAVAERVDAGIVFINNYYRAVLGTPFGGNRASGYGREHAPETLRAFSRSKSYRLPSGNGEIPRWSAVDQVTS